MSHCSWQACEATLVITNLSEEQARDLARDSRARPLVICLPNQKVTNDLDGARAEHCGAREYLESLLL